MKIIFVRHAEPQRGVGDKKREDHGLTDVGRRQAEELASKITFSVDQIVTSTPPRAVETGKIVADALGFSVPIALDCLCEIGERSSVEVETLDEFFRRIEDTMNTLARDYENQTLLVVSHAGFIMGSVRALFNIPTPGSGARLEPEFTSLTQWQKEDDIWELTYFNRLYE